MRPSVIVVIFSMWLKAGVAAMMMGGFLVIGA
jgi:hypothetical protein